MSENDKNKEEMTLQKLQEIEKEIKGSKKKVKNTEKAPKNGKSVKYKGNKKDVSPIMDTPIKANQVISDEELEELKRKKKKNNKKKKSKGKSEAKIEELIASKKGEKENSKADQENKEESEEIEAEKLEKISKELRLIRLENDRKRHPKLFKIFVNIVIAIVFILYIYLIMMLPQTIGKDSFILCLKITSLVLAAVSVILLEIGFSKKKASFYFHALEFLFLAGYTYAITLFIIKESYLTKAFQITCVSILALYFIVKSIIIAVKVKK